MRRALRTVCTLCPLLGAGWGCAPANKESASSAPADNRWYAPGHIDNRSGLEVRYWKDGEILTLPPHGKTGLFEDVDHVEEPATGRWCKVGGFKTAVVKNDGNLERCPTCWTHEAGQPCPKD